MRTAVAATMSVSAVPRLPLPNWDIHLRARPGDWDLARRRGRPRGERRLVTDAAARPQGWAAPDGYSEVSVALSLRRKRGWGCKMARRAICPPPEPTEKE